MYLLILYAKIAVGTKCSNLRDLQQFISHINATEIKISYGLRHLNNRKYKNEQTRIWCWNMAFCDLPR